MHYHLRIARPVTNLVKSATLYQHGLALTELSRFEDHQGFDGVMLGDATSCFHIELTYCRHHPVTPSPTAEDLLVFYVPDQNEWHQRCEAMQVAGFSLVEPFNPYWAVHGKTFQDEDGYRVVIQHASWPSSMITQT
jgi:hypothetical protein